MSKYINLNIPRPKKLNHDQIWKDIQTVDQKKSEYPYSYVDIAKRYGTNKQTIDYIRKKMMSEEKELKRLSRLASTSK